MMSDRVAAISFYYIDKFTNILKYIAISEAAGPMIFIQGYNPITIAVQL